MYVLCASVKPASGLCRTTKIKFAAATCCSIEGNLKKVNDDQWSQAVYLYCLVLQSNTCTGFVCTVLFIKHLILKHNLKAFLSK